jgi:hypothetical protein
MRGSRDRRRPAAKLAVGLVVALLAVAAASYAAVGPVGGGGGRKHRDASASGKPTTIPVAAQGSASLRIVDHPHPVTARRTARFHVLAAGEAALRCRLDRRRSEPCGASVVYRDLRPGNHRFLVAARRAGRRTVRADFGWRVIEPMPFEVEPTPADVGPLYPGATPLPIRVVITNPNPVAITVTALRVTAGGGAPGCDAATNVALTAPDLGAARPRIPAHGTLTLPSAAIPAPTIALRETGADQDACQGASFDLSFSGSAGA